MDSFMIRFLICNVFISGIIGILLIAKRMFKNDLTAVTQLTECHNLDSLNARRRSLSVFISFIYLHSPLFSQK